MQARAGAPLECGARTAGTDAIAWQEPSLHFPGS
jgi:hypothetical protein